MDAFMPRHLITVRNAFLTSSAANSWLAVDPWEVTRKRIMDYMSVLEHAREVCQETFPGHAGDITILYMCQTSQVRLVRSSHIVRIICKRKQIVPRKCCKLRRKLPVGARTYFSQTPHSALQELYTPPNPELDENVRSTR